MLQYLGRDHGKFHGRRGCASPGKPEDATPDEWTMWREIIGPGTFRRMLSFATIGGIATAAHYAILIFLVEVASLAAFVASGIGYICGAVLNYWLNYHLTFQSQKRHFDSGPKFMLIAIIGLGINSTIVAFGTEAVRVNYLVVQVVATLFVLIWNFVANSVWTFARPRD